MRQLRKWLEKENVPRKEWEKHQEAYKQKLLESLGQKQAKEQTDEEAFTGACLENFKECIKNLPLRSDKREAILEALENKVEKEQSQKTLDEFISDLVRRGELNRAILSLNERLRRRV